jgi:hypothetical protein
MAGALFGLLLVVHGLVHLTWIAPKPDDPEYPFRLTHSPVFKGANSKVLSGIGAVLVVVSTLAFLIAGLGVWGVPGFSDVWRVAAIVGAAFSILVVAVFWHRWFLAGPLLDVAIIVAAIIGGPTR